MPLSCPQCGYQNADEALLCNLCQAILKKGGVAPDAPAAPPPAPTPAQPSASPVSAAAPELSLTLTENIWRIEIKGTRERLEIRQGLTKFYMIAGGGLLVLFSPLLLGALASAFSHPLRLIWVPIFLLCAAGVGGRSGVIVEARTKTLKGWSSFFGWRIEHEDRRVGPLDTVTVTREWREDKRRRWEVYAVRVKTGGEEIDLVEGRENAQTILALADLAGVLLGIRVEKNLAA